jgi:hypothetical protein
MRMTVRKLIFRASLSGLALGVIPGMPASASDIVHNPHARSG